MNNAEVFNMLDKRELTENFSLTKLNRKIMKLENEFREKMIEAGLPVEKES